MATGVMQHDHFKTEVFRQVGTGWRAASRQRSEKSMGNRILSNENIVASFLLREKILSPQSPFGFGYSLAKLLTGQVSQDRPNSALDLG
jgi:hypothetical protein